ncbi:MAG TPA: ABC transporter ATP-binding protein [Methylococcaceae bacterium]|nr:ABC transporter ATP-binding protein [Methylococcaceae bacterium]
MAETGLTAELFQHGPIPLDVNLACRPGELLGLVGPSGAGKSTVLRAVAGLYQPRRGTVSCNGQSWLDSGADLDLPPHRRPVGLVFQNYALFPHLSALGNVSAALSHLPRRERAAKAGEWLARVHLAGLEGRYPRQLSGGQQQRVAVARALARDPQVLLLDEPFSAVDQVTRRKLYRELAELRHSLAMPIVLVTHDLDEAALLADRLVVLYRGATLQSGAPDEVAQRPATALVARLMDQPNLFTGQVVEHDPAQRITRLLWLGRSLDARLQAHFRPGSRVSWMIPAHQVLLHRRDQLSRGERENPLSGRIAELLTLGSEALLSLEIDRRLKLHLSLRLPVHVVRRNNLAVGDEIGVSLLAQGIHLMPYEEPRRAREHSLEG